MKILKQRTAVLLIVTVLAMAMVFAACGSTSPTSSTSQSSSDTSMSMGTDSSSMDSEESSMSSESSMDSDNESSMSSAATESQTAQGNGNAGAGTQTSSSSQSQSASQSKTSSSQAAQSSSKPAEPTSYFEEGTYTGSLKKNNSTMGDIIYNMSLELSGGSYTYNVTVDTEIMGENVNDPVTGTYTVNGNNITMTGDLSSAVASSGALSITGKLGGFFSSSDETATLNK